MGYNGIRCSCFDVNLTRVKVEMGKQEFVVFKHKEALKGTGFECCAGCPGTSGRVEKGKMRCSRSAIGVPVEVTKKEAQKCASGERMHPHGVAVHLLRAG